MILVYCTATVFAEGVQLYTLDRTIAFYFNSDCPVGDPVILDSDLSNPSSESNFKFLSNVHNVALLLGTPPLFRPDWPEPPISCLVVCLRTGYASLMVTV